ncbi:MAG: MlaD family protein [Candidatus Binatia bacterium]
MRLSGSPFPLVLLWTSLASAAPLPVVVDFYNSKGLESGAPVLSENERIGTVERVGFGENDTVEVVLRIDAEHRDEVKSGSTFVIVEKTEKDPARVEHFVLDPRTPPARHGQRFEGARSLAEVWLRRGRLSANELNRALDEGVDAFRRNLEELQRSPEWSKFRDQLAGLAAELTVTGKELSRLLDDQLPKLQKQLDDLYRRYQQELERREQSTDPDTT